MGRVSSLAVLLFLWNIRIGAGIPKWRVAGDLRNSLQKGRPKARGQRYVVWAQLVFVLGGAHDGHHVVQRQDGVLGAGLEVREVFGVLFRPEEMDAASSLGPVLGPFAKGDVDIALDTLGLLMENYTVFHLYAHVPAAVQARRVNAYGFSRKRPADRQGLEASLAIPFLLAVNGDAVLVGQVVEGREGSDQVGAGIEPHGH
jgi:hypothetical protein